MQMKPVQYHLEAYEKNFANDPFHHLKASTPFLTFNVGDFVEPREFGIPVDDIAGKVYRVTAVQHIVWEVADHIGHKLMLLLKLEKDSRYDISALT